jgi:hypothetical protein
MFLLPVGTAGPEKGSFSNEQKLADTEWCCQIIQGPENASFALFALIALTPLRHGCIASVSRPQP